MKRILIIDDDMAFLRLLSSILSKQFHTYETAGLQEAIKLLETTTVDAICSDFNMRDGTGMELFKMLRHKDVRIPFLLMSASDEPHLADEAQSWDASFCCKTDYELLEKIKAIIPDVV